MVSLYFLKIKWIPWQTKELLKIVLQYLVFKNFKGRWNEKFLIPQSSGSKGVIRPRLAKVLGKFKECFQIIFNISFQKCVKHFLNGLFTFIHKLYTVKLIQTFSWPMFTYISEMYKQLSKYQGIWKIRSHFFNFKKRSSYKPIYLLKSILRLMCTHEFKLNTYWRNVYTWDKV